jgi:hypothetical protein
MKKQLYFSVMAPTITYTCAAVRDAHEKASAGKVSVGCPIPPRQPALELDPAKIAQGQADVNWLTNVFSNARLTKGR